jgi:hypothetical protein
MLLTNSTRLAIVLILTLTLMENEIVSTGDTVTYSVLFWEEDQYKQRVIEQGSTLTLTCLEELHSYSTDEFQWKGPNKVK